ncbi:DUF924 domain-containing protein [Cupriavidus respiraculi]|uniref:DUF924 domain-containing protein n=1 Tax=Cupriavidus respiraculi TaxID=195930 RepID=A0ABM8X172_9BURK|nr:DUF924 family protein [Cupriavidus respiraculi]CAG9173625.1 hypothetical protein LMG21510_02315 [Cupriavidus respiraculi]
MSRADDFAGTAAQVLGFWFGEPGSAEWDAVRSVWFTKSEAFDAVVRERFLGAWEAAHAGTDGWDETAASPQARCARIVLLDQFPRNMFRGDPRSFATDAQALALATRMVESGDDLRQPTPWHRMFCYMPFEHAESAEAQRSAVRLMTALRDDTAGRVDVVEWAVKHQVVIDRFGRFPHRNRVLGRVSTPEEEVFLREPGSSF